MDFEYFYSREAERLNFLKVPERTKMETSIIQIARLMEEKEASIAASIYSDQKEIKKYLVR